MPKTGYIQAPHVCHLREPGPLLQGFTIFVFPFLEINAYCQLQLKHLRDGDSTTATIDKSKVAFRVQTLIQIRFLLK